MTMKAELVKLLQQQWVTPLDALQHARCLSLSQRVGELKRAGVAVIDRWQPLPTGKKVKAYRIPA